MRTQVQRWGNSLAVRIPRAFADELGLERNTTVDFDIEDGCLVLRPHARPTYRLESLLSRVTGENIHGEQDFGEAVGGEEW